MLPWKKKKDDDPDLEALLEEGNAPDAQIEEEPSSSRPSEEEDLLDQYLNSDTQTLDSPAPSAGESGPAQSPPALDLSTEDDDTGEEEDDSADAADDVMSIFEDEPEEDEDMIALSKTLVDITAEEILTEARTVSRKLARLAEGRVPR